MNIERLNLIQAIADCGNISVAAKQLGVTQSMLTKVVAKIEKELNVSLFARNPRGVELTRSGQRLLKSWHVIDQRMGQMGDEVSSLKAGVSGSVVLGAGQWWIDSVLPKALGELGKSYPDISVEIRTGTYHSLVEQLLSKDIDIVLKAVSDPVLGMEFDPVIDIVIQPMVRQGHPLTKMKRDITLADIGQFPWVLPPSNDPACIYLTSVFKAAGLSPPMHLATTTSYRLMMGIVSESDAIGYFPSRKHHSEQYQFEPIIGTGCDLRRKTGFAYCVDQPISPATRVVSRIIRSCAEDLQQNIAAP